jgi:hypothetical protein
MDTNTQSKPKGIRIVLTKYPEGNNMAVVHLGARPVRV